jgi:hypothetical protein
MQNTPSDRCFCGQMGCIFTPFYPPAGGRQIQPSDGEVIYHELTLAVEPLSK